MTEGARTMESLNEVTHIIMDKTGTLTQGQLQMSAYHLVEQWQDRWEELSVLICAAEEHNGVAHPTGFAVFRGCLQGIKAPWQKYKSEGDMKDLEVTPGQGLSCRVDVGDMVWRKVCLGNAAFLESMGITVIEKSREALRVYVAVDDEYAGMIRLEVREFISMSLLSSIAKLKKSDRTLYDRTRNRQSNA